VTPNVTMSAMLSSCAPNGVVCPVIRATRPSSASNTIATNTRITASSKNPTTVANGTPGWVSRNASATFAIARKPKNRLPSVIRLGSTGTSLRRRRRLFWRTTGRSSRRGAVIDRPS
jgi:hypothetical protein